MKKIRYGSKKNAKGSREIDAPNQRNPKDQREEKN